MRADGVAVASGHNLVRVTPNITRGGFGVRSRLTVHKNPPAEKFMFLASILFLAAVAVGAFAFGRVRWRFARRKRREQLEAARLPPVITVFDESELDPLPAPVQRYFRAALTNRQAVIAAASFEQTGTLNLSETAERWKPFSATQRVVTTRPGFDWDARMTMGAGIFFAVHDSRIAGEGSLRASVCGLIAKADLRDRGELARGELLRFFMEAVWYPTALLPSQGLSWSAVDDHQAQATLQDGGVSVTLLFRFNDEGLIDSMRAEARARISAGKTESLPWEGRVWSYATCSGMRIPLEAEVAWILPGGAKPYCRAKLTHLRYEFAA